MEGAKISVIVPVYKVEPYLRRCLDSIVGQSYKNLEIILVDDGSPDNCGAICDEYAAKDERIKVIHKLNGGVSTARNAGLAAVTGEWIGWVDSDDWIEADMYEYLLRSAKEYEADIAVCSRYKVYENRKVFEGWTQVQALETEEALELLLKNGNMQNYCCDKLFRAALWREVRFPKGRNYEDIAVMHRLFIRARRVVCLPGIKYNYFQRPGSIVADISLKNRMEHYQAAKERYDEIGGRWPEMDPLLLRKCAASAVGIWCAYCYNPKADRQAALPQLKEISAFCAPHAKAAAESLGLGLAGKLVLALVPYATWWSFALAQCVSRLYELKHGKPL